MTHDYSGLAPQFQPGGGQDPIWMKQLRVLLEMSNATDNGFVRMMFEYYDAVCEQLAIERKLNGTDNA